jgi:hypothetical protein
VGGSRRHRPTSREDAGRRPPLVSDSAPQLATLHVWRVPASRVPAAVARMAADRWLLRRVAGLSFARLLGTADGRTFTLAGADLRRWALLCCWRSAAAAVQFDRHAPTSRAWSRLAVQTWRVDLRPIRSRGRWSGQAPFETSQDDPPSVSPYGGPVAVLTRARLRPTRATRFWRAVPAVADELARADGLAFALGVSEAPMAVQGTFSLWRDTAAMESFAYRGSAHRNVVDRTVREGWYAEELFARFAVVASAGTVDVADPLPGLPGGVEP